ncbi:GntR family transcriptional regulator [Streptomyces sp. NPDC057137]|uniref:GntR family transcriptional regulator n=1 Tax=Streptomyces sp. NPDC057137 TaxID=3346030 RepID=UPI0036404DCE
MSITVGEYRSGERLPSANVLGDRFGVSSSTVQNALRVLKQEGLVYSQLGGAATSATPPAGAPKRPTAIMRKPTPRGRTGRSTSSTTAIPDRRTLRSPISSAGKSWKAPTLQAPSFLPPLHDDDAEPDMSPSEKLKTALAESTKRRQQRP